MIDRHFLGETLELIRLLEHKVNMLQSRLYEINSNARQYVQACEKVKREHNGRGDRLYPDYHKANEGLCAVRILMAVGEKYVK